MKRICGWCKKALGEKAPFDDKSITCGICDKCFARQLSIIDDLKERKVEKDNNPVNSAY